MMRLSLEALTLTRGSRTLVEGLSAAFGPGALVELTGPNGSGKTTLLRAIAGLIRPAGGVIRLGDQIEAEDRGAMVHLLGHRDGLKAALTPLAHARFWAGLFAGDGDGALAAMALERVGLKGFANLPTRVLSQGQSRRLALSRLLIAPRPIWLLDEPAAGLDRAGKRLLVDLIDQHIASGGLVLAAVHEPIGCPAQTLALGGA
jgi:heme exporter protein A